MPMKLFEATVDDLVDAFVRRLGLTPESFKEDSKGEKRNLVYGLKGLANHLGCSVSTAMRIKKSGVLNAAIHQTGKVIVIDADLALDLLKVKKGRKF